MDNNIKDFEQIHAELKGVGVELFAWDEILAIGKADRKPIIPLKPDDMITLTYTSGSTGKPKGIIVLDKHLNRDIRPWRTGSLPVITISFGPLAHATARRSAYVTVASGGRLGIFNGSMDTLFEDIAVLRPTFLTCPPRVWNQMYTDFLQTLDLALKANPDKDPQQVAEGLYNEIKMKLGCDRLWSITTGGAPTSPEVISWMKDCFKCGVFDSYGTTEIGGVAIDSTLNLELVYKLVDVPELGYFSTDQPLPRGELWVKPTLEREGVMNYYKDEVNSKENYDAEGYATTGDIVELNPKTRKIKIIDRRKNFFKLAQSEFVAPERVENILLQCPLIYQIWIYAESIQSYVVGVVVLKDNTYEEFRKEKGISDTDEQLSTNVELIQRVLRALKEVGEKGSLRPYEIPKAIKIDHNRFTVQNGLQTPSFKLSRASLVKRYREEMRELYKSTNDIMQHQIQQQIADLVANDLNIEIGDGKATPLVEMGVDSVKATKLLNEIKERFKVEVPISVLYNNAASINAIGEYVMKQQQGQEVKVDKPKYDWFSESTLPSEVVEAIKSHQYEKKNRDGASILLTGVTGFVGAFLLNELLAQKENHKVFCLIRTKEKQEKAFMSPEAMKRLEETLTEYQLWNSVREHLDRVIPVAGDLEVENFGLTESDFDMLCQEVSIIYHNGARVNGILPYETLRASNVIGTKTALKIASKHHLKLFCFVSTLSIFNGNSHDDFSETAAISTDNLSFVGGYAASKRAAELLVKNASEAGLPTVIVRLGTITGHSITGATNMAQYISKVLHTCLKLKIVPDVAEVTIDMTPVNFAASAIVGLCNETNAGHTYHIYNRCLAFTKLFKYLNKSGFGTGAKLVSTDQFTETVTSSRSEDECPLFPLKSYFQHGFPGSGAAYPNQTTRTALSQIKLKYPKIGRKVICSYFNYINGLETAAKAEK
jgi:fatty acid CoA ligase FadD9